MSLQHGSSPLWTSLTVCSYTQSCLSAQLKHTGDILYPCVKRHCNLPWFKIQKPELLHINKISFTHTHHLCISNLFCRNKCRYLQQSFLGSCPLCIHAQAHSNSNHHLLSSLFFLLKLLCLNLCLSVGWKVFPQTSSIYKDTDPDW